MIKLEVKALSVNDAWQGQRFKTPAYKNFERTIGYLLPAGLKIPEGKLSIYIEWGFSNPNSDIDNPAKMFIDRLQEKYKFNDNKIYELHLKKVIVPKEKEYIKFEVKEIKSS